MHHRVLLWRGLGAQDLPGLFEAPLKLFWANGYMYALCII